MDTRQDLPQCIFDTKRQKNISQHLPHFLICSGSLVIQPSVVNDLSGKGSVAEFDYLNSETSDYVLFNRNFPTKTDKMFIASPLQSLSKYMYSPTW